MRTTYRGKYPHQIKTVASLVATAGNRAYSATANNGGKLIFTARDIDGMPVVGGDMRELALEKLFSDISRGKEFPDAVYSIASAAKVPQSWLEKAYDDNDRYGARVNPRKRVRRNPSILETNPRAKKRATSGTLTGSKVKWAFDVYAADRGLYVVQDKRKGVWHEAAAFRDLSEAKAYAQRYADANRAQVRVLGNLST